MTDHPPNSENESEFIENDTGQPAVRHPRAADPAPEPEFATDGTAVKGNLVAITTLSYHVPREEPEALDARFVHVMMTSEQPWRRDLLIGPSWTQLKGCWLEDACLVLFKNTEGTFTAPPSQEEQEAAAAKVVELGFLDPVEKNRDMFSPKMAPPVARILIPPGRMACFTPAALKGVVLRCAAGPAKVKVMAVPY